LRLVEGWGEVTTAPITSSIEIQTAGKPLAILIFSDKGCIRTFVSISKIYVLLQNNYKKNILEVVPVNRFVQEEREKERDTRDFCVSFSSKN
jgi:hypothetical protein